MALLMGIIVAVVFSCNALLAEKYDLRLVLVTNDATLGGNFDAKIQIRSAGGTFGMGTSNLVFTYNSSGLSSPTLLAAHNFSGGNYQAITVTEPVTGRVSANIVLNAANNGTTISSTFMDVVTIRFSITDPATSSGMIWRTSSPNATIVFVDDEATLAATNELIGLDIALPVELSQFTAHAANGSIELQWRTDTETNNFGFNIYRSLQEKDDYAQINSEIIRGAGTSTQARNYHYEDTEVQPGRKYYYKLADVEIDGTIHFHDPISVTSDAFPTEYQLAQNYPNPFNPETTIGFSLKESGRVTLGIFNLQGQLVRLLVDQEKPAGFFSVNWNGRDESGAGVSSGVYCYVLKVNDYAQVKKLIFMK